MNPAHHPNTHPSGHDHGAHVHADSADPAIDPVCGMMVKPTTAHRITHEDHEILFCSARCKEKFLANPAPYLHPVEPEPPPPPAATKVEYTCPMHPEIIRDAPGSCPICGMALEPKLPVVGA